MEKGLYENCMKRLCEFLFKDSSEHFLNTLGKKMQHTQISNVCGRGASSFVLGPVGKTTGGAKHMFKYYPEEEDSSRRWSVVGAVKLKVSHTEVENAMCTFVFIGGSVARRSPQAIEERKANGKGRDWQKSSGSRR